MPDAVLYRAVDCSDWRSGKHAPGVGLIRFAVTKETLAGRWIEYGPPWARKRKLCRPGDTRAFAFSTIEEAWQDYALRKRAHRQYLEAQIKRLEARERILAEGPGAAVLKGAEDAEGEGEDGSADEMDGGDAEDGGGE